MTKTVMCVGGSTTLGVRSTRGWPEHLAQMLGSEALVSNRGIAEAKTVDLLRRLQDELVVGKRQHTVLVVAVPSHEARGGGTPPSELRVLLEQVVDWGETYCGTIVLATPTPVWGAPLAHVRGFARPARRWAPKGHQVVRDIARDRDLLLIEHADLPADGMVDAIHPGARGNRWLAERALPVVRQALGLLGREVRGG